MEMASFSRVYWGAATVLYVCIAYAFAKEVPQAYMDEIFHIPQCQAFCEGRFSYWDPMITTFPGLYYAALFLLSFLYPGTAAFQLLQGKFIRSTFRPLCSLFALRFVNIVLSLVCLLLFREVAFEVRLRAEHLLAVDSGSQELGSGQIAVTNGVESQSKKPIGSNDSKTYREANKGKETISRAGSGKLSVAKRRGTHHTENGTAAAIEDLTGRKTGPGGPGYEFGEAAYDSIGTASVGDLQNRRQPSTEDFFKAAALVLYPPHFFFAFLFYTDVGSTAAIAAMYLATLRHRFWVAALLAVVAIFFRQTNVVWALFVTCTGATEVLWPLPGSGMPSDRLDKRSLNKTESVSPLALWALAKRAWTHRTAVLRTFGPLLFVIAAFVVFAVRNGGIVLGAKDAHKMSLHMPQFLYCLAFVFCALAPVQLLPAHVSHVSAYGIARVKRSPGRTLALLLAALAAVHWFTIEHPYLLADNRHYPFYLWRWIFKRHVAVKYLLVPFYLYAATSLVLSLAKTQRPLWIFFYLMATFGVLVPAPLIEFRYFNVPFFLAALHVPMPSKRRRPTLLLQLVLFAILDIGAVSLFLRRTFEWPHESGTQRYMW